MNYSNILKFKGTWRKYQERVLANSQKYIKDGRIHIVAAPGSGKTTLGIELIARIGEPALVLAPSITIREQWVQRIVEGFLCEGLIAEDYISQDLKNPRCITVVTYQALHSAMTAIGATWRKCLYLIWTVILAVVPTVEVAGKLTWKCCLFP